MNFEFLQKANQLADLKKWTALKELCLLEITQDEDNNSANYFLALSLHANNQSEEAREIIEPFYSEGNEYKALYADILISLNSFVEAEHIYNELSADEVANDHYLGQLARINLLLHRLDKAYTLSVEALKINPKNTLSIEVYYLSKTMLDYGGQNSLDESLLELNPNNPRTLINHADVLLANDNPKEAYQLAHSCLQLYPENEAVREAMKNAILSQSSFYRNYEQNLEKYLPIIAKWGIRLTAISYFLLKYYLGYDFNPSHLIFLGWSMVYFIMFLLVSFFYKEPIGIIGLYCNKLGRKLLSKRERNFIPLFTSSIISGVLFTLVSLYLQDLMLLRIGMALMLLCVLFYFISQNKEDSDMWSWAILAAITSAAAYSIYHGLGWWSLAAFMGMLIFPFLVLDKEFLKLFLAIYKQQKE